MLKKIAFPLICMIIGVGGSVCEFISVINDKDMETKIQEEVTRQLAKKEDSE